MKLKTLEELKNEVIKEIKTREEKNKQDSIKALEDFISRNIRNGNDKIGIRVENSNKCINFDFSIFTGDAFILKVLVDSGYQYTRANEDDSILIIKLK